MAVTKRPLVLVGFAEAYAAIEATWSLQAAGFRVAAVARAGAQPALRHVRDVALHKVTAPEIDVATTVSDIRAVIGAIAPIAYLPLDDESVWVGGQLVDAVTIAGPTGASVDYSLDKQLQIEAAEDAELPVPPTRVVQTLEGVRPDAYPAVIKPARALYEIDGRLVRPIGTVIANDNELAAAGRKSWLAPILIQPFLRGTGEGLFGLATNEGVVAWSAHRRIRMVNPAGSASSACASHPIDPGLRPAAERFLQNIGWRGLFMLEFLRDSEGQPWLMELNGRAWGSMTLARDRGFEYPAWTVQLALDRDFRPNVPVDPPDIVARSLGMELVHLAFVLRGPRSAAQTEWPTFWRTVRDLFRFGRNQRLYNWNRSQPLVLAADTAAMIRQYAGRARQGGRP